MTKNDKIEQMLEIIKKITKEIPKRHQPHIFWSPKTNSDEGKVVGYRLYAYGGYVLKIYINEDRLEYETNFHKYKNNYFGDLWDEKFDKRNTSVCQKSVDINTLLGITKLWDNILEAYKKRMYGEGDVKNKYLERGRETTIARNLELNSELKDFYFIEQESRMKVSNKKPDLIGVRNVNGKSILNFVEYKCTDNGMYGVTLTDHLEDMVRFYQDVQINAGYKTLYEQMLDFADFKYWQLEKGFKVECFEEGEIVFLFSNIGGVNGITAQKVYNDVCRLIYKSNKYLEHKEHVKFIILDDESKLYSPQAYMDGETLLKHKAFEKCDKTAWMKERRKYKQ